MSKSKSIVVNGTGFNSPEFEGIKTKLDYIITKRINDVYYVC
jgi:hypothetical protein